MDETLLLKDKYVSKVDVRNKYIKKYNEGKYDSFLFKHIYWTTNGCGTVIDCFFLN